MLPRAPAELFTAFDAADEMARLDAGFAVMDDETFATVPTLVELLDDPRPRVRATAAYTLGRMASQLEGLEADDYRLEDSAAFRQRAATVPATLAKVLVVAVDDPDPDVRAAAFGAACFYEAVIKAPDQVVPIAVAGLTSELVTMRHHAAFALARFGRGELAAPALARVLGEPEPPGTNAWQEAAMALTRLGPGATAALPALISLRDDTWPLDPDLAASVDEAIAAIQG